MNKRRARPKGFFVSPKGHNKNPGTKSKPLRTLAAAQQAVREVRTKGVKGQIVVTLMPGRYELDEPLIFAPEDGGVTYRADQSGAVVVSGGSVLKNWETVSESGVNKIVRHSIENLTLVAPLPRHLYAAGVAKNRSRIPCSGTLQGLKISEDGRRLTLPEIHEGFYLEWKHPEDAEVVFHEEWTAGRQLFSNAKREGNQWVFPENVLPLPHDPFAYLHAQLWRNAFYLENVSETPNAWGTWCYDKGQKEIRYFLHPREKVEVTEFTIPRLVKLVDVRGTREKPVRKLRFEGIQFSETEHVVPPQGDLPGQASIRLFFGVPEVRATVREHSVAEAAVAFEYAEECAVVNCKLLNLAGIGLRFAIGCRKNAILRNHIQNIGFTGLQLGEIIRHNEDQRDIVRNNEVADNVVKNCGVDSAGAVGLWVGISQNNRVHHNEISDLPYTGLSVGWDWSPKETDCRGNRIEWNHIHRVCRYLADGGGIYALGFQPGAIMRGNHIHDIEQHSGIIDVNALFLDNGNSGWTITENVMYDCFKRALRQNDPGPKGHKWSKNFFDIPRHHEDFPHALAAKAGPRF